MLSLTVRNLYQTSIFSQLLDSSAAAGNYWLQKHWRFLRSSWLQDSNYPKTNPNEDHGPIIFNLKPRKVYEIPDTTKKGIAIERLSNVNKAFHINERQPLKSSRRQKRTVTMTMPERTVETLVVVDKQMYNFHKEENILEPYVLTIMNIVSTTFII